MFALAEEGHRSLFRQVVACILSVRTYDEVSLVAARRLFEATPAPADLARLTPQAIDRLIGSVTFHRTKAGSIREIARAAAARPDGELPCDADTLLALPGVGPSAPTSRSASPAASGGSAWTSTYTGSPTGGATCAPRPPSAPCASWSGGFLPASGSS
jgi:hypothetical protein